MKIQDPMFCKFIPVQNQVQFLIPETKIPANNQPVIELDKDTA